MADPTWKPHIRVHNTATSKDYIFVSDRGGPDKPPPPAYPSRDRNVHGQSLSSQLDALETRESSLRVRRKSAGIEDHGSTVTAEVDLNKDFNPESLEDNHGKKKMTLLSVRPTTSGKGVATVFVPEGQMKKAKRKVEEYLDQSKDSGSGPRGVSTVQSVDAFRASLAPDMWTDPYYTFPTDDQVYDWEVWLRDGDVDRFRTNAGQLGVLVGEPKLLFPDRTVVVARARVSAIERAVELLASIAELRAAPNFDADFSDMSITDQAEYTHEMATRLIGPGRDDLALCLLDSGVAWAHPLLSACIDQDDCHSYGTWSLADRKGHGTKMAGIASYGERLGNHLAGTDHVHLPFRLESVKIIEVGTADVSLKHRGAILREAPLHPEVQAPHRTRVFTMTVTGSKSQEGRPTAWSGALDQICAGVDDDPARLVLIAAGNHLHAKSYAYPEDNLTDRVQDPAQSWNAVCVGAVTHRESLDTGIRPGWSVVAPAGDISPYSTVGRLWDATWPNKPDMVMEGGNMAAPSWRATRTGRGVGTSHHAGSHHRPTPAVIHGRNQSGHNPGGPLRRRHPA